MDISGADPPGGVISPAPGRFSARTIVGSRSLCFGGIAAAGYHRRFVFRAPYPLPALQSLIGGVIMGFAWALIPGGNDAMVLYLGPSLALHGIIAYSAHADHTDRYRKLEEARPPFYVIVT